MGKEKRKFSQEFKEAAVKHAGRGSTHEGDRQFTSCAESIFATLKRELIYRVKFANQDEARNAIFVYIEAFYNRQWKHSYLRYLCPEKHESRKVT